MFFHLSPNNLGWICHFNIFILRKYLYSILILNFIQNFQNIKRMFQAFGEKESESVGVLVCSKNSSKYMGEGASWHARWWSIVLEKKLLIMPLTMAGRPASEHQIVTEKHPPLNKFSNIHNSDDIPHSRETVDLRICFVKKKTWNTYSF